MGELIFPFLIKGLLNIAYTRNMATQSEQDKYIKCKGCKCKYINDGEHIKQDSGYNRLGKQLKSCVKCRNQTKKGRDTTKQPCIYNNVNTLCSRCCPVKPKSEFGEYSIPAYDTELKSTREVVISCKSCERCREQHNTYREDNDDLDKTNQHQQSYRERLLHK